MNKEHTLTSSMTNYSLAACTACRIWRHLPVGTARKLDSLQEHSAVAQVFPSVTRIFINPISVKHRLIKHKALSRSRRRRFFLKDNDGWRQGDFRESYQYRVIRDIWDYQDDLRKSTTYKDLLARISCGTPFQRKGKRHFVIDTEARLAGYMSRYLDIMRDIEANGYREDADPDELAIAVSASGELLKVSSGKHRLAMAQVLGIPVIPVRIRHISMEWWRQQTPDAKEPTGEALVRVLENLPKELPRREPR